MRALALGMLLTFCVLAHARNLERVTFPSLDRDASGTPVAITALLLLPKKIAPAGGFPTIVALHGCGGMFSVRKGHEHELAERYALRTDGFLAAGYAVLFPDSFGSRGTREVCTIKLGERTITVAQRRLDALGALDYLDHRKDIAPGRIALVGWSHGGSTALQATNLDDPAVAAFARRPGAGSFFRAVVAFYPGCRLPLQSADRWQPGAPTRVYIGALDDWTPPQPCVDWGESMRRRGADVNVTVYPGSYHAFDAPSGTIVHRTDVPNGVNPGQGVHVGPNPAARTAANADVAAFLRSRMAPD
jgi:dienelactone hydrolase